MRINGLRLLGFKSFVEPTELVINSGLTGVVGPNGCGKSNLLEALRWVMGETSYKTMRASSMDDVIFAGTDNRPARNMSEVTITLDNSERKAPAEFNGSDVLEVTRRIERDSGSSYKINGRPVRARDVQLIFADASTGARSPALVQQGQIGQIVNSKPEARRRILEEAAGITGLHSRRHEAQLRLKAAESNMERLQDIADQLTSRFNSLKRQARQASRYKVLSEQIQKTEAIAMYLNWQISSQAVDKYEQSLQGVLKDIGIHTQSEAAATTAQTEASDALQPLRDQEMTRAAILQRLKIEQHALDKEEQTTKQRLQDLHEALESLQQNLEREQNLIVEGQESLSHLSQEEKELHNNSQGNKDKEDDAKANLESLQNELTFKEKSLSELTQKIADHRAQTNQFKSVISQQNSRFHALTEQNQKVNQQHNELIQKNSEQNTIAELSQSITALAGHVAQLEAKVLAYEQDHITAQDDEKSTREIVAEAKLHAGQLETEVRTLTKLLVSPATQEWPPVIDHIQVQPGYEMALGSALGDDLEASIEDEAPFHWRVLDDLFDETLPELCTPLTTYVRSPAQLGRRLAQIGVIDAALGKSLQNQLKPGQRLVSKEGDLWRWDGYSSMADAPTAAAQRLRERNRLTYLQQNLEEALHRLEANERAHQSAVTKVQDIRNNEQEAKQKWRSSQSELERAREMLSKFERESQEESKKIAALGEAKNRIAVDLQEVAKIRQDTERSLTALGEIGALETAQQSLHSELNQTRHAFSETKATLSGLQRDTQQRDERLKRITSERDLWTKRVASAEHQIKALSKRTEKATQDLKTFDDFETHFQDRRTKLLNEISKSEQGRQVAADQLADMENTVQTTSQALKSAQDKLNETKEEKARIETKLEASRERLLEHASHILSALECTPEECLKVSGFEVSDTLPDLVESEAQLNKLKKERERLGAVNLRAEDEAEELDQQLTGMKNEQADLEQAISRLHQGIANLNREGRKRLLEAYEKVNTHFQSLFTTLFEGGAAELKLVDAQDPLEAGLEIIARPPGKKPQVLSLLSGGEKALTAMSLIFAVFLTNPSPICVLDEVDAPLDDANVNRFCKLLENIVENTDTRFLVITHHPITMSRMDRLFGVTMAEKGISQLVSVDLESAEGLREAS
ncbi:MAG: AAA family ATPase [Pseudomonadota bacterium]